MKRAVKASNFQRSTELWINGEPYCELTFDGNYYKLPISEAKTLFLSPGDKLEVMDVEHEVD